ncbi:MAG: type II secretion system protein [Candidatus Xenobiia bacterium LiM19]
MFRKGMTLIELIVGMAIVLIIIEVSISCIVPAFKNYKKSQEESTLMSNVQCAVRALDSELKYGDVAGITIIPSTYIYPDTGNTCHSHAIAFYSILTEDGSYLWDDDGSPYWQKIGIFYLETSSGNLYYQENVITPTVSLGRPASVFTPRHGSGKTDRLIARGVISLFFTDVTGSDSVTKPSGDYIKTIVTGASGKVEFPIEASIYAKKSR